MLGLAAGDGSIDGHPEGGASVALGDSASGAGSAGSPPVAVVAFVALHDLTATMGATAFAVGTHSPAFAAAVAAAWSPTDGSAAARASLMRRQTPIAPLLGCGDAVLMDSATWHAGGANSSGARRVLFHFTFARRGYDPAAKRKASLLPALRGKHRLDERASWLAG